MILYMSVVSVATSPFSFLILLLWVLSLFFSISLGKSLSGPPRWHTGKDSSCQCKRHKTLSWIPGLGRSSGVENGNPCSILAWKAPRTKEPGGPQSIGLQRVGHHWAHTHTHTQRFINIIPFKEPGLNFIDFFGLYLFLLWSLQFLSFYWLWVLFVVPLGVKSGRDFPCFLQ